MREIAQILARLGLIRIRKGEPLNVRRRERVRRALAEAGQSLGWAHVAALSENPVDTAATDLKKIVRGGVRSLQRELDREIADKKDEAKRLQALLGKVQDLTDDADAALPTEIVYTRTSKSPTDGLITKTETLSLTTAEEALQAARTFERSMPRWERLRDQMLDEMRETQEHLGLLSREISGVVNGWRGLLGEVLVTL